MNPSSRRSARTTWTRAEAVARALQAQPAIIVADEPMASLDATSVKSITELLIELSTSSGATLIVDLQRGRIIDTTMALS